MLAQAPWREGSLGDNTPSPVLQARLSRNTATVTVRIKQAGHSGEKVGKLDAQSYWTLYWTLYWILVEVAAVTWTKTEK